jgi:hypothetical protein
MFEIAGLIVFLIVGLAIWRAIVFLNGLYEDHVPDSYQERIYKTSKDLPKIVWAWFIGLVFWASAGAVLLQFALGLFGVEELLPSTSWAPGIFFLLLLAILFHFWETPHRTKGPSKARGRNLKSSHQSPAIKPSKVSPSQKRGRTIRTYRDLR